MDGAPLLELLAQVGGEYQVVDFAMEGLDARVRAVIARVHGLGDGLPLRGGLDDLPVDTRRIGRGRAGAGRSGQAAGGDARVAGHGVEEDNEAALVGVLRVRGVGEVVRA